MNLSGTLSSAGSARELNGLPTVHSRMANKRMLTSLTVN